MFTPDAANLDELAAVAKDLAAVTNWSIFWQPVNKTFLGRVYGERVQAATGWTPNLAEYEPPNGTQSVDFDLPSGGAALGFQDVVRISHPRPLWRLLLEREGLTPDSWIAARQAASEALTERTAVLSRHLGRPDIGPVEVAEQQAPQPLKMLYNGVVAGWHRKSGTVQLDVWEQADYPTQPVGLDMHLAVRPSGASDVG